MYSCIEFLSKSAFRSTVGLAAFVLVCFGCTPSERRSSGGIETEKTPLVFSPGRRQIELVVGDPLLSPSDQVIRDRLARVLDADVIVVDDDSLSHPPVQTFDLIFVSESVESLKVATKFATVTTPVWVNEPSIFDDMGFVGPQWNLNYGDQANETSLRIVDVGALSGNRDGVLQVTTRPTKFIWGRPAGSVSKIAALSSDVSKYAIFGYEAGARNLLGVTPARRLGWFAGSTSAQWLSADGWQLFDASAAWLLGVEPSDLVSGDRSRTALLIVAEGLAPAGDDAISLQLESLGFEVIARRDVDSNLPVPSTVDVIVVSESARSDIVRGAFSSTRLPVIAMEPGIFPDMGFTGRNWQSDIGDVVTQYFLDVSGNHPIGFQQSLRLQVSTSASKFIWARPGGKVDIVATVAGDPTKVSIFAYESGVQMGTGIAPARRVGFFPGRDVPRSINENGWALFESAIRWLTQPRATLVVGSLPLSAADIALSMRLDQNGYVVRAVEGSRVKRSDVEGSNLLVISESTESESLQDRLAGISVPSVVMEPGLFSFMGLTAGVWQSDWGDVENQVAVRVEDPQHVLAVGATGTVMMTEHPQKYVWGAPSSSAKVVATISGRPGAAAIFAYEKGSSLLSGAEVSARTVGWFLGRDGFSDLTYQGLAMFDAAVGWASEKSRIRPRPVAMPPGHRMRDWILSIENQDQRGAQGLYAVLLMTIAKRVSLGIASSSFEAKLVAEWNQMTSDQRSRFSRIGQGLDVLTATERRAMLGPFVSLDPGDGTGPVPAIIAAEQATQQIPRLRAPHCAGPRPAVYEGLVDQGMAARSVVTAAESVHEFPRFDVDTGPLESTFLMAPSARPRIMGLANSDNVAGYTNGSRPGVEIDRQTQRDCGQRGDGLNPYGVLTDIPCSATARCDTDSGLICGGELLGLNPLAGDVNRARCYSFPIVEPGSKLLVKGFNFWDVSDVQLEYNPIADPGSQRVLVPLAEEGVVSNEGPESSSNCTAPQGRGTPGTATCNPTLDGGNRNHNAAAFSVPQDLAGNWVSLRMMNHNSGSSGGAHASSGNFRHWNSPGEDGRVVHICYPPSRPPGRIDPGSFLLQPFDTRAVCSVATLPSCESNQDSPTRCGEHINWLVNEGELPRSINDCRHSPGTDPVCGETPEWIYSTPESMGEGVRYPMVFVANNAAQKYKLIGRMFNVQCIEETGWDDWGSDELRVTGIGVRTNSLTGIPEPGIFEFKGNGFDTQGSRARGPYGRQLDPARLMAFAGDLRLNEQVVFSLVLSERDCESTACRVAVSSAAVATLAAAAIAVGYACPPCVEALGLVSGVGASAMLATAAGFAAWELAGEDKIGAQGFVGSPADFGERATVSHVRPFPIQREGVRIPGPLSPFPLASNSGKFENELVSPFTSQVTIELDPAEVGTPGSKFFGFREERRITGGGGDYRMRLLWQRLRCDNEAECQSLPDPNNASSP